MCSVAGTSNGLPSVESPFCARSSCPKAAGPSCAAHSCPCQEPLASPETTSTSSSLFFIGPVVRLQMPDAPKAHGPSRLSDASEVPFVRVVHVGRNDPSHPVFVLFPSITSFVLHGQRSFWQQLGKHSSLNTHRTRHTLELEVGSSPATSHVSLRSRLRRRQTTWGKRLHGGSGSTGVNRCSR